MDPAALARYPDSEVRQYPGAVPRAENWRDNRDEANVAGFQLADVGEQIQRRAGEAIQLPDQDDIDLVASDCLHHLLEPGSIIAGTRAGLLDLQRDLQAARRCSGPKLIPRQARILIQR